MISYFAELDENNLVLRVILVDETVAGGHFPESEAAGQAFIALLGLEGQWKQTSFNGNFRGTYAGVGYTYNADSDTFVPPALEIVEEYLPPNISATE